MPLGGKSLKEPINKTIGPKEVGEKITLELLLRIMNRSNQGELRQVAGNKSLLLLEIPIKEMQEKLPSLNFDWNKTGDTQELIESLNEFCDGIWSITFEKYKGIEFISCF